MWREEDAWRLALTSSSSLFNNPGQIRFECRTIEFPRELRGKQRMGAFMRLDNCCLEINSIWMNLPEWAINQPSSQGSHCSRKFSQRLCQIKSPRMKWSCWKGIPINFCPIAPKLFSIMIEECSKVFCRRWSLFLLETIISSLERKGESSSLTSLLRNFSAVAFVEFGDQNDSYIIELNWNWKLFSLPVSRSERI